MDYEVFRQEFVSAKTSLNLQEKWERLIDPARESANENGYRLGWGHFR
jgi:hypothetical protein